MDLVYTWQFAPGSFINIVWKNSAQEFRNFFTEGPGEYGSIVKDGYGKNFSNTMKADDNNNLSLKVIYFLDYLQIKNHKKKEKKN